MWGIIPAAGRGTRIQPLAFSKELLPVGSRMKDRTEHPCAVSEYLIERMITGGADKICFVIAPGKSDILEYFGGSYGSASIVYVVQPQPSGLCDAMFRALPLIGESEPVAIGLPDTVWFPSDALRTLPDDLLSFLLFPVEHPEFFDAVVLDEEEHVCEIQVKQADAASHWIWGAFKMPGQTFRDLHRFWLARNRSDEYVGTLVNAYLAGGGTAIGVRSGRAYVDVGTLHGYRAAMTLLADIASSDIVRPDHEPASAYPRGDDLVHRRSEP
jgi:glucose-1-phosphate thymidylyltransferase